MRLNKHKKPYINPDPPQPMRVKSRDGLVFHPTKAPEGLCKCGVMLELKPKKEDYIFPSSIRARHAVSHTIKYLVSIGAEFDGMFVLEKA